MFFPPRNQNLGGSPRFFSQKFLLDETFRRFDRHRAGPTEGAYATPPSVDTQQSGDVKSIESKQTFGNLLVHLILGLVLYRVGQDMRLFRHLSVEFNKFLTNKIFYFS